MEEDAGSLFEAGTDAEHDQDDFLRAQAEKVQRNRSDGKSRYQPSPQANGSVPTWDRLFTLSDAFQDREPVEYVIEGLFQLPSLSIVFGLPGDFKSMLMMDAAICVAAGKPWLPLKSDDGKYLRETRQVPVFWYDFDNGRRRCDERFQAIAKGCELSAVADIPFYYLSVPTPALDIRNGENIASNLKPKILEHGIKFFVIDNLTTVSGEADENSAEMAHVMSNLRTLVEETHCACVVIHHQRKSKDAAGAHAGESLRGHSSINASVDLALQVTRRINTDSVTIRSTKTRGTPVAPFGAEFVFTPRPDKELETAYFSGFYVDSPDNFEATENAILEILTTLGPLNQTEVITETRKRSISRERTRGTLNAMVAKSLLKQEKGPNTTSKLYSIAEVS